MSNEISFYVFNSFLLLIGLIITYISWCGLKNQTEIIFDQFVMNISFKPYFWLGKTKIINQNIKEFFLIRKNNTNNKQQNKQDNKQNFHYDLYVLLVNKEEIMLISSIQDFEIASEILEKLLKITQINQ